VEWGTRRNKEKRLPCFAGTMKPYVKRLKMLGGPGVDPLVKRSERKPEEKKNKKRKVSCVNIMDSNFRGFGNL